MASVTLSDVRKTYFGAVQAVKGVSLDIADGAFVVLVYVVSIVKLGSAVLVRPL